MAKSEDILSVDKVTRLLRLFLKWPSQPSSGAQEFYNWLEGEFDEESLADLTGGIEGVNQFIEAHATVISAGRKLKAENRVSSEENREEERVSAVTAVFVVIYDCVESPSLEGESFNGLMMDMARNGMRLESDKVVPVNSIVTLAVVSGSPVTLYHLTGEVRWTSQTDENSQIGISIFHIEDYEKWLQHFEESVSQA